MFPKIFVNRASGRSLAGAASLYMHGWPLHRKWGTVSPASRKCRKIGYEKVSAVRMSKFASFLQLIVQPVFEFITCGCYKLVETYVITLPPVALRSIVNSVSVCLSVCLSARIYQKHTSRLHERFCSTC